MKDNDLEAQETALDRFVTEGKEFSPFRQSLDEAFRRSPWWVISLIAHIVAIWVLWHWPVSIAVEEPEARVSYIPVYVIQEGTPVRVDVIPGPEERELVVDEREIDLKNIPLDVPIEDIPYSDEPVSASPGTKGESGDGGGTDPGQASGPGTEPELPVSYNGERDDWRPVVGIDPPSNTPVLSVGDPTKHVAHNRDIYGWRVDRHVCHIVCPGPPQSSVDAGLIWLAKAQEKDGHWDCKAWDGGGNYDVGMTGLALLSYLGAGYTHTKGRYKDVVSRGLEWLRTRQQPNGSFGCQTFYEQGIATMAVSEAYGMTRSEGLRSVAQKAVDFIVQSQPEHGGFRYAGAVDKASGDMSVTGWQIMAIKSAICSELSVPMQAMERSREFLKNTLRESGGSAYLVSQAEATPAMSAIGMLCREFLGGNYDAEINAAANYLMEQQKKAGAAGAAGGQKDVLVSDLYYTYYSVLAMFQMGGEYWVQWNKWFRDPLVKLQETKNILDGRGRFVRGSWDPKDTMWGAQGGRVFSTAMAVLSLEVYYRFLSIYKR